MSSLPDTRRQHRRSRPEAASASSRLTAPIGSPRRIGVVGLAPGVGRTTVSLLLAAPPSLVVVTPPDPDQLHLIGETLQWLDRSGFSGLAGSSVVVLNGLARRGSAKVVTQARQWLSPLCWTVLALPPDRQLAAGDDLDIDRLSRGSRRAGQQLAGDVLTAALSAP